MKPLNMPNQEKLDRLISITMIKSSVGVVVTKFKEKSSYF